MGKSFKTILVVLLIVLSISACGSTGNEESQGTDIDNSVAAQTNEPEITKYKAGTYKIGADLPAGEYKVFSDGLPGYFEITKDSTGSLESIVSNDNFETFTYISVEDNQYLKLQSAYAIPASEASPYDSSEGYGPGKYKVGFDIPAGEYNVQKEEGQMFGYVEVSKDSTGNLTSIVTNDNFETNKYITVQDGQYLKIQFAHIK